GADGFADDLGNEMEVGKQSRSKIDSCLFELFAVIEHGRPGEVHDRVPDVVWNVLPEPGVIAQGSREIQKPHLEDGDLVAQALTVVDRSESGLLVREGLLVAV